MTFQEENNEILKYILDDTFFNHFKTEELQYQKDRGLYVEFYVTSVCNQKCTYCYLTNHGDKLYPKEIRDIDIILKNEEILLNYFIEKEYDIYEIDFFSGEIWGMDLGNRVFDKVIQALKNGLKLHCIMVPSNMTFILNKNTKTIVQKYIDEFNNLGVHLLFSASVDGKFLEDTTRSYKNENNNILKQSKNFYEDLIDFCIKNHYGFHPMISTYGIEYWKENFQWWIDYLTKHNINWFDNIMFLEVRNNDWTKEKINKYIEYLDYSFDKTLETQYKNNLDYFIDSNYNREKMPKGPSNYRAITLDIQGKTPSCSIKRALFIRLGDLMIVPCHRLSYNKLNYGKFVVKDNKISGIEANNIQLANKIYYGSTQSEHKCDVCDYKYLCIRGCLGSQFETNKDPLIPCSTVCDLYKTKINFLIKKYESLDIFNKILKNKKILKYRQVQDLLKSCAKIKKGENYREWEKSLDL